MHSAPFLMKDDEMMPKIAVINGPNLNLLGSREPEVYGTKTLKDIEDEMLTQAKGKATLEFFQSNHEGSIIDYLQKSRETAKGIIINPGAFTHTSVALRDCLAALKQLPIIEVHISQPYQREAFRKVNYVSPVCTATASGFGTQGYSMALGWLLDRLV